MINYLISDLAKKSGLSPDTIRFYEKKGLIKAEFRADNQYRYFNEATLKRLLLIKRYRSLNIGLKEIENLIELQHTPQADCGVLNTILDQHIDDIENKINELKLFQKELKELRQHCHQPTTVRDCQIFKTLESDSQL